MPTLTFFCEAWLEVTVLQLKNGSLDNYEALNQTEHRRSAVLAFAMTAPYVIAAIYFGLFWMLIPVLINRRLVFDPALKLMRSPRRRLTLYEGTGPVDGFCSRIFGRQGAGYEIALELAASVAATWLQLS